MNRERRQIRERSADFRPLQRDIFEYIEIEPSGSIKLKHLKVALLEFLVRVFSGYFFNPRCSRSKW